MVEACLRWDPVLAGVGGRMQRVLVVPCPRRRCASVCRTIHAPSIRAGMAGSILTDHTVDEIMEGFEVDTFSQCRELTGIMGPVYHRNNSHRLIRTHQQKYKRCEDGRESESCWHCQCCC